jgi:hypothetical protein
VLDDSLLYMAPAVVSRIGANRHGADMKKFGAISPGADIRNRQGSLPLPSFWRHLNPEPTLHRSAPNYTAPRPDFHVGAFLVGADMNNDGAIEAWRRLVPGPIRYWTFCPKNNPFGAK